MSQPDDRTLARLRAELDNVDDVPLGERVELFERVNAVVAEQLAELDEV